MPVGCVVAVCLLFVCCVVAVCEMCVCCLFVAGVLRVLFGCCLCV